MNTPKLEIFDPPMCCSTGICGPSVDPKLVQVAADLKWLELKGVQVARFNLSQNPAAFVENQYVNKALAEKGESVLPLIMVDEKVIASGEYPDRTQLAIAVGLSSGETTLFSPAIAELVAIGAAIAANCEPCFKYHYTQALRLGVSKADMANAVRTAASVKDSPHQSILRLADKLVRSNLSNPAAASDPCCGSKSGQDKPSGKCCG
jgi:AhpD family alkylhydroperoxidase